jgi:hypothetical protein
METVIRNVGDLSANGRDAAESLVGHPLDANQRLVIHVLAVERRPDEVEPSAPPEAAADQLPEWCDVYAGLSDGQIGALEQLIARRLDLTRPRT